MEIKLPDQILELFEKFFQAGYQLYLVGGSVRDLLMGRPVNDWDFTTDAIPDEILRLIPEGIYGNKFGTVIIPPKGKSFDKNIDSSLFEITTMRKEGDYRDHRHPAEVGWTNNIEEDLNRRDFTINAIALTLMPQNTTKQQVKIIDPFDGQKDLSAGIIKTVGQPNDRFNEDALRLIRAIRISSQLNFEIEEQTLNAINSNAPLIQKIAYERIRDELFKILSAESSYEGFIKLRETGLLKLILPELDSCFGIVQEGPKHDRVYDIGEHSLLTLKYTPSSDPLVKLAAVLHDIGKVDTVKISEDGNVTFYNHEVVGAHKALEIAKKLKLSNNQTGKLIKLIRYHMFSVNENQTDSAIRRFIKNVGLENIPDIMALRVGDRLGGGTEVEISWRMENFQKRIKEVLTKPFTVSDLMVNGNDIMQVLNIPPGPKVGNILNMLFKEVLTDSEKNNREYLLKKIKQLA